jgi:Lrp/AsnC family transcriptional regulator
VLEGVILGKVALLDGDKLGLSLTAFVRIKTQQHSSQWYQNFVEQIESFPEVLSFYRMAGEYDYLMQVQVADMKSYDNFYKKLVSAVPGLLDVTSNFAMERIKSTTHLPL